MTTDPSRHEVETGEPQQHRQPLGEHAGRAGKQQDRADYTGDADQNTTHALLGG